jgi:beta-glucanase (GH16 family)
MTVSDNFRILDESIWDLRSDTFPSNLALFDPKNFSISLDHAARLVLTKANSTVREYKAASICTRRAFLYGRFAAEIRPARGSGLISGFFLHRNSPRQEIDIEFLGRDTSKMLINVFYNPGSHGACLDFGYRGTPVLIDLEFDASSDFHRYELNWTPDAIRWLVDGVIVHERDDWEYTPIPQLPMQLFVNLWPSRSSQLAGKLATRTTPALTEIRLVNIEAHLEKPIILPESIELTGSLEPSS